MDRVELNSVVTFKYLVDEYEYAYKTIKISDESGNNDYITVKPNSPFGKALLGRERNEIVPFLTYNYVVVVDIINSNTDQKVIKDSIVEVELYNDPQCNNIITSDIVRKHGPLKPKLLNKRLNSVIKVYSKQYGASYYFIKIKRISSNIEEQLLRREKLDLLMDSGDYDSAIEVVNDIEQFIADSVDITEDTLDIFRKIVVCSLNKDSINYAVEKLSFLLRFNIPQKYVNSIEQMQKKLKELKTLIVIPAPEIRDYTTLIRIGKLYKDLRAYDKSIFIYKKAKEINHNNPVAFNALGGAYRKAKKYPDAIEAYKVALSKNYKREVSYIGLGAVYNDLDQMAVAVQCYENALLVEPDSKYANNGLGAVYIKMDLIEQANECFFRAKDPEYWNMIVNKLMFENKLDKALKSLNGLLDSFPNYTIAKRTAIKLKNITKSVPPDL